MNHLLHVVLYYFIMGFLGTCLLIQLYHLYWLFAEYRKLQRETYNAYMNMVQGMEDRDEEKGI